MFFLKNVLYLQSQSEGFCSFLPKESGRSSVRLEYTSGGRVVAGSNPVTPTDGKALIIQQLSVLFFFIRTCRKWAVDATVDAKKSTKKSTESDENIRFRRLLQVQGTCKRRIPADAPHFQRGPPHDEKSGRVGRS